MDTCNDTILHSEYTDEFTFLLSDELYVADDESIWQILFSGPRPGKSKCEVAGIVVLKRVKIGVYGINNINLTSDSVETWGMIFSFNKQIASKKNCEKHCQKWKLSQILENEKSCNWR